MTYTLPPDENAELRRKLDVARKALRSVVAAGT